MVYYIYAEELDMLKIGYTAQDVEARLSNLMTGSPCDLVVLACEEGSGRKQEKELHQRWAEYRSHREWFDCSPGTELRTWMERNGLLKKSKPAPAKVEVPTPAPTAWEATSEDHAYRERYGVFPQDDTLEDLLG